MKKLNRFLLSLVAMATLSISAFAKPEQDIVDTAVGAGQFKTLAKLLTDAGLVDVLKGDGPFTVFAPTDAAFAKVPKATLAALAKDKNLLIKVLTYHVVPGRVLASDVVKIKKAKTVAGPDIHVMVKGGKVKINKSNVVKTDILCTNGVIHVIDTVLLPPSK